MRWEEVNRAGERARRGGGRREGSRQGQDNLTKRNSRRGKGCRFELKVMESGNERTAIYTAGRQCVKIFSSRGVTKQITLNSTVDFNPRDTSPL
jgi:hypothetical protein